MPESTLYQLSHGLAQQVVDFIEWLEINNLSNIVITHYRAHERVETVRILSPNNTEKILSTINKRRN